MIDIGASLATFFILFPIAFTISFVFFYIKKQIRIKRYRKLHSSKEV